MDPYLNRLDELKERMGHGLTGVVPQEIMEDRWARLRKLMARDGLDALVIYTNEQAMLGRDWARYFANYAHCLFNIEMLIIIPLEGEPALTVNFGFLAPIVRSMSPIKDVRAPIERFASNNRYNGLAGALQDVLQERGVRNGRIGFAWEGMQGDFSPWELRTLIESTLDPKQIVNASQLPFEVIINKTDYDRAMIKRAAQISSKAMEDAFLSLHEGGNEYDAYLAYQKSVLEAGCDVPIFHCVVQSGESVHHLVRSFSATGRKLKRGDMILMDAGLCYQGYYNDTARTAIIGAPTPEQTRLYNTCKRISERMTDALMPGEKVNTAVRNLRDVMKEFGYTKTHGLLGHSTGIMLNEPPYFMDWNETVLQEGWVINIEPSLYRDDGYGGCRIEDTFIIRADGPERITTMSQDLWVIE